MKRNEKNEKDTERNGSEKGKKWIGDKLQIELTGKEQEQVGTNLRAARSALEASRRALVWKEAAKQVGKDETP